MGGCFGFQNETDSYKEEQKKAYEDSNHTLTNCIENNRVKKKKQKPHNKKPSGINPPQS